MRIPTPNKRLSYIHLVSKWGFFGVAINLYADECFPSSLTSRCCTPQGPWGRILVHYNWTYVYVWLMYVNEETITGEIMLRHQAVTFIINYKLL